MVSFKRAKKILPLLQKESAGPYSDTTVKDGIILPKVDWSKCMKFYSYNHLPKVDWSKNGKSWHISSCVQKIVPHSVNVSPHFACSAHIQQTFLHPVVPWQIHLGHRRGIPLEKLNLYDWSISSWDSQKRNSTWKTQFVRLKHLNPCRWPTGRMLQRKEEKTRRQANSVDCNLLFNSI